MSGSGDLPDEINLLADEVSASLIAMSSHGKTMVQEMLVGSTTLETAIHARMPLLVIRYRP